MISALYVLKGCRICPDSNQYHTICSQDNISVVDLAKISLRSLRDLFFYTIKTYVNGIKVSKKRQIRFDKSFTGQYALPDHVLQTFRLCTQQYCTTSGFLLPKYRIVHPENYLFSLSLHKNLDQSTLKIFYLNLKKEALCTTSTRGYTHKNTPKMCVLIDRRRKF